MKFNAQRAKSLVEDCPLKRSVIADNCGITVNTLTKYLNKSADPSRPVVMHLARVLAVNESELWSEDDKKSA